MDASVLHECRVTWPALLVVGQAFFANWEKQMSKYPETIRLFLELNGGKLEWWEPITDRLYRVKLVGENERIVRQSGSELLTWGKKK